MTWETMQLYLGLGETQMHWIVRVFIVVLGTLVVNFSVNRGLLKLDGQLTKTRNAWDNMLIRAVQRPLRAFIWLVGLSIAAEISGSELDPTIAKVIEVVRQVGLVAVLTWFLLRCVKGVEEILTSPDEFAKPVDVTTASAVSKLLRAAVLITSALVIMQNLGYSISGVLAFGGIGVIAVGFAAKDLLANFFGGLMVYLDRPFAVGDWIRSPDKDIEGTVENIGWRQTRIRTFDKRPLYVPNSTFSVISVENPSRMTNRRINETIGIRYDDFRSLEDILQRVRTMLVNHKDIDTDQIIMVNFNQFGPSSLDFFIYTFTKTVNWAEFHEVKEDVLIKIMQIIEDCGAEIAFPTTTVHVAADGRVESKPISHGYQRAVEPSL